MQFLLFVFLKTEFEGQRRVARIRYVLGGVYTFRACVARPGAQFHEAICYLRL